MNILIIGSGGREHAIAWKIAQSPKAGKVYAAPGNGGIAEEAKCEILPNYGDAVSPEGQERLIAFARSAAIDLTIVGPETPLAEGIADRFRTEGLAIIGPTKAAARLEASKGFAKSFMQTYGVRTASSRSFSDFQEALTYAAEYFQQYPRNKPLVVKADGLAAGKGVVIAEDYPETEAVLRSFMQDAVLGSAGKTVLLEDYLSGKEVSVLAGVSVSPGKPGCIRPFISARDYKRRYDWDCGPNTGGMGAASPAPGFSEEAHADFTAAILEPTLKGLEQEGFDYRGFIFFGLMVQNDRCYLLEYNVRLGDPETQAVLPLADFDIIDLCSGILEGSLADVPLCWKSGAVCAPVAVACGYPGTYRRGDAFRLTHVQLPQDGMRLFFGGVERRDGKLYTAGGRVAALSVSGPDMKSARDLAYKTMKYLAFKGMDYRMDIGAE